jgi:hypothetical protein
MTNTPGPGVATFWRQVEDGKDPDVAALVRSYPEETAALADAMEQWQSETSIWTRERLWSVRNAALEQVGKRPSVGAVLRERRIALGLTEDALAGQLERHGTRVASVAIQMLESGQRGPATVRPPSVWATVTQVLGIDPVYMITLLQADIAQPRAAQSFTRMARGASEEDREAFIAQSELTSADTASTQYVEEVRRALGLPFRRSSHFG